MNDLALYRKYRPTTFDDVLGQDHIVKVLKSAISLGNIAHSYLFFGTRGTGKTSVARIIAHELGVSNEDTFEIDAASTGGIDDIRELREAVVTAPFNSKYKIYILDEVHMLSKAAWNGLLKTLEEPPKHVIFILATTEIEKVPETIVSRCQTFTFNKPTLAVLKELVLNVAKKEGFQIDASGAELLAVLGDGSFRDTHGILQKIMSFSKDKKIDLKEIEIVTGAPQSTLINQFIESLVTKNISKGLEAIKKASEQNIDMQLYLKLILMKLRQALLLRYAPEMKKEIMDNLTKDDQEFITGILKEKAENLNSKTLQTLLETSETMKYASIKALALELGLIKILE